MKKSKLILPIILMIFLGFLSTSCDNEEYIEIQPEEELLDISFKQVFGIDIKIYMASKSGQKSAHQAKATQANIDPEKVLFSKFYKVSGAWVMYDEVWVDYSDDIIIPGVKPEENMISFRAEGQDKPLFWGKSKKDFTPPNGVAIEGHLMECKAEHNWLLSNLIESGLRYEFRSIHESQVVDFSESNLHLPITTGAEFPNYIYFLEKTKVNNLLVLEGSTATLNGKSVNPSKWINIEYLQGKGSPSGMAIEIKVFRKDKHIFTGNVSGNLVQLGVNHNLRFRYLKGASGNYAIHYNDECDIDVTFEIPNSAGNNKYKPLAWWNMSKSYNSGDKKYTHENFEDNTSNGHHLKECGKIVANENSLYFKCDYAWEKFDDEELEDLTIGMRFRVKKFYNGKNMGLFQLQDDDDDDDDNYLKVYINQKTKKIHCILSQEEWSLQQIISNSTIKENEWYSIVVTRKEDITSLYLNGKIVGSINSEAEEFEDPIMYIGCELISGKIHNRFYGCINQAFIFNENATEMIPELSQDKKYEDIFGKN